MGRLRTSAGISVQTSLSCHAPPCLCLLRCVLVIKHIYQWSVQPSSRGERAGSWAGHGNTYLVKEWVRL
eukprot:1134761-Pelagomonas_calceolata.AAC.1